MIIRLIGDNWVPEDKIIVSVRDEENVKMYLPNIMKKLSIKRMGEYRLYFTSGERKCDYLRPIDVNSSWKELGLSGGSAVYISSKDPEIKAEEAAIVANCETTDDLISFEKDNNLAVSTMCKGDLLDHPAQKAAHNGSFSRVPSDGAQKIPVGPPTSHTSPLSGVAIGNLRTSPAEPHVLVGLELSEPMVAREDEGMTEPVMQPLQKNFMNSGIINPEEEYTSSKKASLPSLAENSVVNMVRQGAGPPMPPMGASEEFPSDVYHKQEDPVRTVSSTDNSYHKVLATQEAPLCDVFQRKRGFERDTMLRRYERTAYIVSLYEFAHLELKRQRQRAAALREEAERGVIYTQNIVPKPLYRL